MIVTSKEELLRTLDAIKGVRVLVVGDVMLDRYIWGKANRISAEAPVPVVAITRREDRPGGAGNTVRNLAYLGAKVSVCGLIGEDSEGEGVRAMFQELDCNCDGLVVDPARPTTTKTRVIAQAQQVVRIDHEDCQPASGEVAERLGKVACKAALDVEVVILSDYGKGAISEPLLLALKEIRGKGSLKPFVLDPHPANYALYETCQVIDVAKPNRPETEKAVGYELKDFDDVERAGKELLSRWGARQMLITLGEDGLAILSGKKDKVLFRDTVAREVFDVSGAGDTVTAVYGAAIGVGAGPAVAGDLANIAAGIVVSEVGTVAITYDRLKDGISEMAP